MNYATGYIPDIEDTRDYEYGDVFRAALTPTEVDYRNEMLPVRSQGAMGSCVAFAMTGGKEWQESYQRGFKTKHRLSPLFLYSHVQVWPGGGSRPRDMLKILQKTGVPLESQYKYKGGSDLYKLIPPKDKGLSDRLFNTAQRFRISGYARLRSTRDVIQSLATNGPCVMLGLEWLEGWYKSKTLKSNDGQSTGGHCVELVGYSRRKKHFIIRNSWGDTWQEGGHCYIPFATFEKYMIDCWTFYDLPHALIK